MREMEGIVSRERSRLEASQRQEAQSNQREKPSASVLREVKEMQLYINQTHGELNELIHSLAQENALQQQKEIDLGQRLAVC